ncbi:YopX family protein [Enterococcus faecalis]|uniref:YopX family protein n=1 Tax=Enterococcus faecalis TaxID=1351 RepID=UPI000B766BE0|nr:YopX family protein [Enterococcus faecalis]PNL47074.1 DNA-packaging protein [Enterococcus faecalis]
MIPKFRAYYAEKMWYVAKIDLWGDPEQTTCDLAPYLPKYDELFDIPLIETALMQSTGLKDKNGVEIFEGDILKIIEVTNEGISEYITDVIWEDCSFVFKSEGVDYYDSFLGAFSGDPNKTYPLFELLVIGNVWDNSKLLEEAE